jgi:hypothetical protein
VEFEVKVGAKAEVKVGAKAEVKVGAKAEVNHEVKVEERVEAKTEEEEEKVIAEAGKVVKTGASKDENIIVEMATDLNRMQNGVEDRVTGEVVKIEEVEVEVEVVDALMEEVGTVEILATKEANVGPSNENKEEKVETKKEEVTKNKAEETSERIVEMRAGQLERTEVSWVII